MFKVHSAQASGAFVWLLNLYGGSLDSYLTIALQNELFTVLGRVILKYTSSFI